MTKALKDAAAVKAAEEAARAAEEKTAEEKAAAEKKKYDYIPGETRAERLRRLRGEEPKFQGRMYLWDLCLLITMFCALGFLPGNNLGRLAPESIISLINYGVFALQIVLMLMGSGKSIKEVRVVNVKSKYIPIYIMIAVWFFLSMISTHFVKEQIISCVRFSVTALYAIWVVEHYELYRILDICYYASIGILGLTLIYFVMFPGNAYTFENGERTFCGIYPTKNPCASELAFAMLIQALIFKDHIENKHPLPKFFYIVAAGHVFFILICKATGALFSAVLPILYLFMTRGKWLGRLRLPFGWLHMIITVGFLVFAMTVLPIIAPLLEALGKDATLTGRTPMWEQMIKVMSNHNTFTGWGFTMFWKDNQATTLFHKGFSAGSWGNTMNYGAHSTLIEMWMDVGLIGTFCYFFMIILSVRMPGQLTREAYDFTSAYLIWQTLKGLTERSYIAFNYQTLFLFLCCAVGCNRVVKIVKRRWERKA